MNEYLLRIVQFQELQSVHIYIIIILTLRNNSLLYINYYPILEHHFGPSISIHTLEYSLRFSSREHPVHFRAISANQYRPRLQMSRTRESLTTHQSLTPNREI